MKRSSAILFTAALCVFAQSSRDAYVAAYHAWRHAEPNLEREAGQSGDSLAQRANHAAAEAAKFGAAHGSFLRASADRYVQSLREQQNAVAWTPTSLASSADFLSFIAAESAAINGTISAFANDTDPGFQSLEQALERERDALTALNSAITDREKADNKMMLDVKRVDQSRARVIEQYHAGVGAIRAAAASIEKETAAWSDYYHTLAEAIPAVPAPVVTSELRVPVPMAAAPPPAVPSPSPLISIPVSRYSGAWTYALAGGLYHGPQPEFADIVVLEENGKATGTFNGRFKLPAGTNGDGQVRFTFSGELGPDPIQTFALETSDGNKGTIDLIPGNDPSHLEVNFEMGLRSGKINRGNLLMVKH